MTICHSIMCATRPKSFISPLHLGLGVLLHKKFASRRILDIFSRLGVCSSYKEVLHFQNCLLLDNALVMKDGSYFQFVYDNADFNINTLDGKHTFHSMGGIMIIYPKDCFEPSNLVERKKHQITASTISNIDRIPLQTYGHVNNSVITYDKLVIPGFDDLNIRNHDVLWIYGKHNFEETPGWNGFMLSLTRNLDEISEDCRIVCLPFVNSPPSNLNTIYSVLKYSSERAKKNEIIHLFCNI